MLGKNSFNKVKIETASSDLFAPKLNSMYQTDFSGFYYRSPASNKIPASNIETIELYNPEEKMTNAKKSSLINIQDSWSKSEAHKRYHEQFSSDEINYLKDPVWRRTGKKVCGLSPGIMYKDVY